jgi:hypothetical protein
VQHSPRYQQPSQQHHRQQQAAGQGQDRGQNQRPAQQAQPSGQRGQADQSHRHDQRSRMQVQKPASNDNRTTPVAQPDAPVAPVENTPVNTAQETPRLAQPQIEPQAEGSPRSGVEILSFEERDGVRYYTVRDLRNKSIVRNVTKKSARDLWLYALMQHAGNVYDLGSVTWYNDRTILSRSQRAGKVRYDIALMDDAKVHIFYGVSEDTMDTRWKELIQAIMPPAPEDEGASSAATDASSDSDTQADTETGRTSQPVAESGNLPDNALPSDTRS